MPEIKQNIVSKTVKDAATAKGHTAGCTWACLSVCVCVRVYICNAVQGVHVVIEVLR